MRFGEGQPVDDVWLSAQSTTAGTSSFQTLGQFDTVTNSGWTQITPELHSGRLRRAVPLPRDALEQQRDAQHLRFLRRRHRRHGARAAGHRGPDADQGHPRLPDRGRDRQPRDSRVALGAAAEALRPGHARELHEAGGLVRRERRLHAERRGRRPDGVRPGERPRGLRSHAGLAQPDPGLVLPEQRRRSAHHLRRRSGGAAHPAARPHLLGGGIPQRHLRRVRQRHQPAVRVRRGQRGRLRQR